MNENCVFCKIAKKEIPANSVYEDEEFVAFLDIHPRNKGHVLVIPKKHYRWTYDVPNFGEYAEIAKKVAIAAKSALGAEWVMFLTFGWQVPHAHIHVIPRFKGDAKDDEGLPTQKEVDKNEMDEITEKIKLELK